LSEIAQRLAHDGVQPGAYLSLADAALVTADNLAARGDTVFITRLPAPESDCGRVMAEAVAPNRGTEVGVWAQTPPTRQRPGTFYTVAESSVPFYGKRERAVVVHSSSQDQRRPKARTRALQPSSTTRAAAVRQGTQPEDCCQADAEAAAAQRQALQSA
jgi:hypothetical protein